MGSQTMHLTKCIEIVRRIPSTLMVGSECGLCISLPLTSFILPTVTCYHFIGRKTLKKNNIFFIYYCINFKWADPLP